METVTLSSKYQLVVPKGARKDMRIRPGARFTVIAKGGVLYLIPDRKPRAYRGIAKGLRPEDLREKKDRL